MRALRIVSVATVAAGLSLSATAAAISDARIEGRWKVTYEPRNFDGDTGHADWKAMPQCGSGACTVTVRAKGVSEPFTLRYDASSGGYHGTYRYTLDCVDGSGNVLVADAYNGRIRFSLKVREADADGLATRVAGRRGSTYVLNAAGRKESECKPQGRGKVEHVSMVPAG